MDINSADNSSTKYANYNMETGERNADILNFDMDRSVRGIEIVVNCPYCGAEGDGAYCENCGNRKILIKLDDRQRGDSKSNIVDKMMGFFGITKN